MVKKIGKLKATKSKMDESMEDDEEDEDESEEELGYPGIRGTAVPEKGRQQVKGFKFSGTY